MTLKKVDDSLETVEKKNSKGNDPLQNVNKTIDDKKLDENGDINKIESEDNNTPKENNSSTSKQDKNKKTKSIAKKKEPKDNAEKVIDIADLDIDLNELEKKLNNKQSKNQYPVHGVMEIKQDFGVLRQFEQLDENMPKDVYVAATQINKLGLRSGDEVRGIARAPKKGERYLSLLKIESVAGGDPFKSKKRPSFDKLTPIHPNERLNLEFDPKNYTTRVLDLLSPIGKGQRGMIVAPPKAGKTWLLKDIAHGITKNHPEVYMIVVLIGERPEEVTEMQRSIKGKIFASNFDESAQKQIQIAESALEIAKRKAEMKQDVVILMDSITRLARAYNIEQAPSGRTLTGGFDPAALYPPKKYFGAARNFEQGGSLTILATALIDTGSKMDDVIFEEFKGTGNMELFLSRELAERRIYPTINMKRTMTRHEELLYTKAEMEKVMVLRRMIDLLEDKEVAPVVLERLRKTKTNQEFLDTLGT